MPPTDRRRRAVRFIIHSRTVRRTFFSSRLFGEPAWDLLLTLYADALDRKQTTITQLSEISDSGFSTTERWIKALEQEGLVIPATLAPDGSDAFTLSERGWFAMDSYFENMSSGMI